MISNIIWFFLSSSYFWYCYIFLQLVFVGLFFKFWSDTEIYRNVKEEHRDKFKNCPFNRIDAEHWNRNNLLVVGLITFWPRFFVSCWLLLIESLYASYFAKHYANQPRDHWSVKVFNLLNRFCPYTICCLLGCIATYEEIPFDYSPYLGKDYDKSSKAPLLVSNHVSWADILIYMGYFPPGFISKKGVKKLPGVGNIAQKIGCIFVDRDNKENKKQVFVDLENKVKAIKDSDFADNFLVFPEGTTTNGSMIIKFRKGAFFLNVPVRPMVHIVSTKPVSPAFEVLPFTAHLFFLFCSIPQFSKVLILPPFVPNETLFEGKEGEKWEIYAEAVRDAMSVASKLPKSDLKLEDKFSFFKEVYPSKVKED